MNQTRKINRKRNNKTKKNINFRPKCFVTGGQNGADSIPFSIHDNLNIKIKGYMPEEFKRDDNNGKEIARRYGLKEGKGGFKWRDKKNASLSNACIAFLTTKPNTGKGTMQTVNIFVNGIYDFIKLKKPLKKNYKIIKPKNNKGRPVIIFWDISEKLIPEFSKVLRKFLNLYKPNNVMITGSTEKIYPNIEKRGVKLLSKTLSLQN